MIKNIIIIILILGFIGIIIFLDIPEIRKVLDLRQDSRSQRQILQEKQELINKVERLSEDYRKNEENLEKANYILPFGTDEPNLIVQLEALALAGGLALDHIELIPAQEQTISKAKAVRAGAEKESKDYKVLTISLKLIGDYTGLKSFLKVAEENIRLLDVQSINFSSQTQDSQFFIFDISLKTYYQ